MGVAGRNHLGMVPEAAGYIAPKYQGHSPAKLNPRIGAIEQAKVKSRCSNFGNSGYLFYSGHILS